MSNRDEAQERAGELLDKLPPNVLAERVTELMSAASVDLVTADSDPTAVDPETGDRTVMMTMHGERVISWGLLVKALEDEISE